MKEAVKPSEPSRDIPFWTFPGSRARQYQHQFCKFERERERQKEIVTISNIHFQRFSSSAFSLRRCRCLPIVQVLCTCSTKGTAILLPIIKETNFFLKVVKVQRVCGGIWTPMFAEFQWVLQTFTKIDAVAIISERSGKIIEIWMNFAKLSWKSVAKKRIPLEINWIDTLARTAPPRRGFRPSRGSPAPRGHRRAARRACAPRRRKRRAAFRMRSENTQFVTVRMTIKELNELFNRK